MNRIAREKESGKMGSARLSGRIQVFMIMCGVVCMLRTGVETVCRALN
jgi:hypothetical protein